MASVPNIFALGQDAYKDAYSTQDQIMKDRTKIQAGRQLSTGDYTGAASTLNANGQIDEAHNVVADQQVLQARSGAADARAKADKAAEAQRKAEGLLRVVDAVQAAPAGQRLARLQSLAPIMHNIGVDPGQLGAATEADLTDANLESFKALVGKAAQDYTIGNVRYAGGTNKPIAGFAEFDPRKTIYAVGDPPPSAPAPAAGGQPPAPVGAAPASLRVSPQDRDQLARMMVTEAGGEGPQGMAAVAHVALNRLKSGYGGAGSLSDVVNAPNQFEGMSRAGTVSPQALQRAGAIADQVLSGQIADPTNGADQFLNPDLQAKLGRAQPKWADGSGQRIGNHVFYGSGKAPAGQGQDVVQGGAGQDTIPPPPPPAQIPGFHIVSQAKPEWQDMADGRQRNIITNKVDGTAINDDKPLSPEGVALVGALYLRIGPDALKNMGQGKAGIANKNAAMEWVAKTAKEAGTSNPELVARFAQNKANLAALTQNTKMLTAISASSHTLDTNLDLAMSFAKKGVGPTGVPLFDTPINKLREQLGSVDAKNLDNLLTTTGNEYAKILSSATGTGGATSDSARAEAQRLIHSGMTLRQLTDAVKIAKQEAENRRLSYVGENARLSSEISGIPQPAAAPQARVRKYNPATGGLE